MKNRDGEKENDERPLNLSTGHCSDLLNKERNVCVICRILYKNNLIKEEKKRELKSHVTWNKRAVCIIRFRAKNQRLCQDTRK